MALFRLSNDTGPAAPSRVSSAGLLVLRVVGGVFLIVHGLQKLDGYSGFAAGVREFGWPLPDVAAALTVLGEAGLGLLLLVGAVTRLAGALLVVLMALIWITAHGPQGLIVSGRPGINGETALLYLVFGFLFATVGAGAFSADRFLRRRPTAAGRVTEMASVQNVDRRAA